MSNDYITTKLGNIGKVSMCRRVLKQQTSDFGDIPFFKIATFGEKPNAFISRALYEEFRKNCSFPKKGEILISAAGTLGKTVIYDGEPAYFQDSNIVWIENDESKILNSYLYYFYQTDPWLTTSGSTINRIYNEDLKNITINHPASLAQQEVIASVLSTIDAKMNCNNQINAELESIAKMVFDYWFVQFDFPDSDGKPYKSSGGAMVYNDVLKREIPIGWQLKHLSNIANITMGTSPAGDSLSENNEGIEFFQGSTDFGWRFPAIRQYTTAPIRMAKKGDILLSVRAPVGEINIAHIDCCIGRGLAALNSKDGFDGFLFYVMQYFKTIFDRRNSEGTTFGSITKDDLHSLPLAYPDLGLLNNYNDVVSNCNQVVFDRSMENQKLKQLRNWLLPMLMNGQVKVA
jgi:type I restriction enzyme S subunit